MELNYEKVGQEKTNMSTTVVEKAGLIKHLWMVFLIWLYKRIERERTKENF